MTANNKQICLITGATSGIGLAVARALVSPERILVIHGRDDARLKVARETLLEKSPQAEVHTLRADFASLGEVRDMAAEYGERFARLDVLINNAGLLTDDRQTGKDGFELTFTVNHLAPMLLTWSLLPLMRACAPARIMFNSSSAGGDARLNLNDLQNGAWHGGWAAYANTKLANMLMSNLFAEKLADSGVVCNSFCPGLIATGLLKDNKEFSSEMRKHMANRALSVDEGAVTAVFLASTPEAEKISGAFFLKSYDSGKQPLQMKWDRSFASRLWERTEEILQPWLAMAQSTIH